MARFYERKTLTMGLHDFWGYMNYELKKCFPEIERVDINYDGEDYTVNFKLDDSIQDRREEIINSIINSLSASIEDENLDNYEDWFCLPFALYKKIIEESEKCGPIEEYVVTEAHIHFFIEGV